MKKPNLLAMLFLGILFTGCQKEEVPVGNFKPKSGTSEPNALQKAKRYSELFGAYRYNNNTFPYGRYTPAQAREAFSLALGFDYIEKGDGTQNHASHFRYAHPYVPDTEQKIDGKQLCGIYDALYNYAASEVDGENRFLWLAEVNNDESNFTLDLTVLDKKVPPEPGVCNDPTPWIEGRMYARFVNPMINADCGGEWFVVANDTIHKRTLTGTIDGGPDPNIPNSAYAGYIWWMNYNMNPTPAYCWSYANGIYRPYIAYDALDTYIANYNWLAKQLIDNYYLPGVPPEYKVADPGFEFFKMEIEPTYGTVNYQGYTLTSFHKLKLYYYDYECVTLDE